VGKKPRETTIHKRNKSTISKAEKNKIQELSERTRPTLLLSSPRRETDGLAWRHNSPGTLGSERASCVR
jgi:hypothetical protein